MLNFYLFFVIQFSFDRFNYILKFQIGIHDCQAAEDAQDGGNKSDDRSDENQSDEDEM